MKTEVDSLSGLRGKLPVHRFLVCSLAPPLAALAYPFLLIAYHTFVVSPDHFALAGAVIMLLAAFLVPLAGMLVATHPGITIGMRRLAFGVVAVPSLYVFLGVMQGLLGSTLPDPLVWCGSWIGLTFLALRSTELNQSAPQRKLGLWRVAHGISALILCVYVLFHLGNHLMGLVSTELHAEVMDIGRRVYRADLIEPILVLAFIFQVCTGLFLAWRWSASSHGWIGTFQIASGIYLSVFVLGHMNSVFIYARAFLGIPTDWAFARGGAAGMLLDPWNIRLVPHYTLGVFLVLAHLLVGLKVVLETHYVGINKVRFVWISGLVGCGVITLGIMAGMVGVRI